MSTPKKSQNRSSAGAGAVFLTLFASVWDTMVFKFLLPQGNVPFWFKTVFVVAGLAVTWGALYSWYQRIRGGQVRLKLEKDPVPHGVPVGVEFQLDRAVDASDWQVETKIESSSRNQSGFGLVWAQDYSATTVDGHRLSTEITLPSDFPSTESSDRETTYRVTLTLKANGIDWAFDLNTRAANSDESQFALGTAKKLGNKKPTYSPAQVAASRKRFTWFVACVFVIATVAQLSFFFDLNLWSRAKALVGLGAYSTSTDTAEFDIRVTNYLINDWALRGRLIGKARIDNGTLIVLVDSLQVQPVGACEGDSRVCKVESVSLLLARDGEKHFSTIAHSDSIAVNADLKEVTRWSLPPERAGTQIRMRLPATMDSKGIKLKLEIRSAGGSTVYPDHGPRLDLQRALASARGAKDPCMQLTSALDMVQADCSEQLRGALNGPAKLTTLDELLLEALRNESLRSIPVLLAAGASPNAHSKDDPGHTALGYAAASNDVTAVKQLIAAGAQANATYSNHLGQSITPLTQALRTDAAAAVGILIEAGAAVSFRDPNGWTPMHIAAYESANLSLIKLVQAGANVNEPSPAYRQQSPLQTALQFGSAETVRTLLRLGADKMQKDNEQKDACDWARFWKRSGEIQGMVCT